MTFREICLPSCFDHLLNHCTTDSNTLLTIYDHFSPTTTPTSLDTSTSCSTAVADTSSQYHRRASPPPAYTSHQDYLCSVQPARTPPSHVSYLASCAFHQLTQRQPGGTASGYGSRKLCRQDRTLRADLQVCVFWLTLVDRLSEICYRRNSSAMTRTPLK